ncbi:RIP metalloprotease RseP [bacterium]|nr:RIP metalloprotease RseP [bacterium]
MFQTIVAFVLTLGIVIIIHELGHFSLCKWTGIYVKTFSIGFGPKILRKRFGETEYALSVVPFGGYVKMAGEGVLEEIQDTGTGAAHQYPIGTAEGDRAAALRDDPIPVERHFRNRPTWQRLAVVLAGPLANLLLAFFIYTSIVWSLGTPVIPVTTVGVVQDGSPAAEAGLLVGDRIDTIAGEEVSIWRDVRIGLIGGPESDPLAPQSVPFTVERDGRILEMSLVPRQENQVWYLGLEPMDTMVGLVQKGGPAAEMGLRTGDRILALNDEDVHSFGAIARIINAHADQSVSVRWEREGVVMEASVVPEAAEGRPDSTIGRIFFDQYYESQPVGVFEGLRFGYLATTRTISATFSTLSEFFLGRLGMDAVGGPIRIGQVAGEMLRWSFGHLMQFIAFFSVNLFLLNLLPIPVLDGGHVVFILLEMIFRRQVHERVQAIATQVGLIMLLLFMTFVIVVDVLKLIPGR